MLGGAFLIRRDLPSSVSMIALAIASKSPPKALSVFMAYLVFYCSINGEDEELPD